MKANICDIPQDKLYRIYSSLGTFYVPLFIMAFVYIQIYLETKRRLRERAKQVAKLAKSMANNTLRANDSTDAHVQASEPTACSMLTRCFLSKQSARQNKSLIHSDSQILEMFVRPATKQALNPEIADATTALNLKLQTQCRKASNSSIETTLMSKTTRENSPTKTPRKMSVPITLQSPKALHKLNSDELEGLKWRIKSGADSGNVLQQRQKISLNRERRAARTLGFIMGAFIICWCPFFIVYLLQAFDYFKDSDKLFTCLTWLGYVNSALNPVIYTVFNIDFRKSFKRILFDCILFKRR